MTKVCVITGGGSGMGLEAAKLIKDRHIVLSGRTEAKLQKALDSGQALEIFAHMVSALGGPKDFCDSPNKYLPHAALVKPVFADKSGWVTNMQTRNIGLSVIGLKGGRITPEQKLDYATGYTEFCQIGEYVDKNKPLAVIHAQDEKSWQQAADELKRNISISEQKPTENPVIMEHIS